MEALTPLALIIDGLLVLGLLWLAWRALNCTELFTAIVLFIAFGLLMALAWVRLEAPDIALAEAAIGAGLTGALLLAALARLQSPDADAAVTGRITPASRSTSPMFRLALLAALAVAAGLGHVVMTLPADAPGLSHEVAAQLAASGVGNPVTAVLLNFRGYDTLLELVVLLLALLGVWSLGGKVLHIDTDPSPVLDTLSRQLLPVLILVAFYLLWAGADAPGGAFQAGAVLGAAGVLLLLAGWRLRAGLVALPLRIVLIVGPSTFVLMAVVTLLVEGQLLAFPVEHAGLLILIMEGAAMLSIGATLAALFMGGNPDNQQVHR